MSTTLGSRFLDLRALASTEHMRFSTRQRLEGAYLGRHASRTQGGSGEFVDFREYSAGEDLRRLDWKVLSRTGRAYVRLFQDETNVRSVLAIDATGSMLFGAKGREGRGSKLEYAQYLASALAYVVQRGQDQVGLAVLGDVLHEFLPPGGTPTHLGRVHQTIEQLSTTRALTCAGSLRDLFSRAPRRGVLIIMSDFLMHDLEEAFAAIRLFRHRQWDVVLLHLVHPDEARLPEKTVCRFEGLEGEGHVDCSPAEIRAQYEILFERHLAAVRTLALSCGCDYRRVSLTVPWTQTLGGFLIERSG